METAVSLENATGSTGPLSFEKTLDATFVFTGLCPLIESACRIRIYETPYRRTPNPTVFVASQIPGTCGTSVTNAAEEIATEILRMQRARRGITTRPLAAHTVWVEDYPPACSALEPEGSCSIVTFEESTDGTLHHPVWQEVTRQYVEGSLLHASLAD